MLRTLRNNSKPETSTTELELCVKEFENSGYKTEKLIELKQNAINKINEATDDNVDGDNTLIFPIHFFDGINEFKGYYVVSRMKYKH